MCVRESVALRGLFLTGSPLHSGSIFPPRVVPRRTPPEARMMRGIRTGSTAVALMLALAACDGSENFCTADTDCNDGEFCDLTAATCTCGDRDPTSSSGGSFNAAACA